MGRATCQEAEKLYNNDSSVTLEGTPGLKHGHPETKDVLTGSNERTFPDLY